MFENRSSEEPLATSRREQNKVETRRRILAAAARLLASQGLQATTADVIASAAEVSRATFFNYFSSKSAVIAALVAKHDNDFATAIGLELGAPASTAERLEHLFVQTATRLQSAAAYHKMILGESERGYSQTRQSGQRFDRMHQALRELLADGLTRGEVRTDYPVELLAEIVGGAYVALLHNWRVTKGYPLEARMKASARFLVESIAPAGAGKVAFNRRTRK